MLAFQYLIANTNMIDNFQDCQNGVQCLDGACSPGCRSNLDCSAREQCSSGQCVNPCDGNDCGQNARYELY